MKKKTCSKCKMPLFISNFYKDSSSKNGYYSSCKKCSDVTHNNWILKNTEKLKVYKRAWSKQNYLKNKKKYKKIHQKYPWKRPYKNIKTRCTNKNNPCYYRYGGRGIKCLITEDEVEKLWFRDKAYLLDKPSIDREDNDGHYTYDNCRFIEMVENIAKDKRQIVLQFNLDGNFIREWKSQADADRSLKIYQSSISSCCTGKRKTAGGFKWRYKNETD